MKNTKTLPFEKKLLGYTTLVVIFALTVVYLVIPITGTIMGDYSTGRSIRELAEAREIVATLEPVVQDFLK